MADIQFTKKPVLVFKPIALVHGIIGYWHHYVVRLSVCSAVHCGSQGRYTGLKVLHACY